jgi:hypothetical protein
VRDPRQELADLVDLLEEVGARVEALEADLGPGDPAVTGGPEAAEERAVRTARARLAARRSREMREGLAAIREDARELARRARETAARARGEAAPRTPAPESAGREPTTWLGVERACAILTRTRPDDAEEVFRRSREALRVAVPAARWTALVSRDAEGRLAVASGDDVLGDLVAAEPDHGGALAPVPAADAEPVTELDVAAPDPGPHAEALGVGSLLVLCPPALPTERAGTPGAPGSTASWPLAVVLGAPERGAFGSAARAAARVVALQVGLLLVAARRVSGLHAALESRDLIGQAKGIVMHRDRVDADTAFHKLVGASQYANLKLHAVARWLVEETAQARNVALGEQP